MVDTDDRLRRCILLVCVHGIVRSHALLLCHSDAGMFSLEGADHPGIVHKLTTALAQHGLNIDKMETDQEIAPYGGTLLFRMRGVANAFEPLPKTFDVAQIKEELEELGDSLNCEVHMEDVVDDSASGVFYAG